MAAAGARPGGGGRARRPRGAAQQQPPLLLAAALGRAVPTRRLGPLPPPPLPASGAASLSRTMMSRATDWGGWVGGCG